MKLDKIFSVVRKRPAPKRRAYRATWPCGSTWEFDRHDLEVPDFTDGDQNGATFCFSSLREAREVLSGRGCLIELI